MQGFQALKYRKEITISLTTTMQHCLVGIDSMYKTDKGTPVIFLKSTFCVQESACIYSAPSQVSTVCYWVSVDTHQSELIIFSALTH